MLELLEDIGGVIINGRTRGDPDGVYTFVGAQGTSVIDYCCCSVDFLKQINDFTVASKLYSDHMPLCIEIVSTHHTTSTICDLPPKLHWNKENQQVYVIKLDQLVDYQIHSTLNNIDDKVEVLKQKIETAAGKFTQPKRGFKTSGMIHNALIIARKCSMHWSGTVK